MKFLTDIRAPLLNWISRRPSSLFHGTGWAAFSNAAQPLTIPSAEPDDASGNRIPGTRPAPMNPANRRLLLWQSIFGFAFGYCALHPISMVIFQWFDSGSQHGLHQASSHSILTPILHSFKIDMLPMGLAYGLLCAALIAVVIGWQRRTIVAQRNNLARQLSINNRYREELHKQAEDLKKQNQTLSRLEQTIRRNTQFMVHDFKAHLNCIVGYSDLLLHCVDELPAPRANALKKIRKRAQSMMDEVKDLLGIARMHAADQPLKCQSVLVADLIAEAIQTLSMPERPNRIIAGEEHFRLPLIQADLGVLKRVIGNLVDNALKHNSNAEMYVLIDAVLSPDRTECIFSCVDNGEGISPEIASSIFDEFSTGDRHDEHSSGLGLAFCREAVQAHGGRIWAESSGGKGAAFYFTIPLKKKTNMESSVQLREQAV